jgi:hypothetical protein
VVVGAFRQIRSAVVAADERPTGGGGDRRVGAAAHVDRCHQDIIGDHAARRIDHQGRGARVACRARGTEGDRRDGGSGRHQSHADGRGDRDRQAAAQSDQPRNRNAGAPTKLSEHGARGCADDVPRASLLSRHGAQGISAAPRTGVNGTPYKSLLVRPPDVDEKVPAQT